MRAVDQHDALERVNGVVLNHADLENITQKVSVDQEIELLSACLCRVLCVQVRLVLHRDVEIVEHAVERAGQQPLRHDLQKRTLQLNSQTEDGLTVLLPATLPKFTSKLGDT